MSGLSEIRYDLQKKIDDYLLLENLEFIKNKLLSIKEKGKHIKLYQYTSYRRNTEGKNYTYENIRKKEISLSACGVLNDAYEGLAACGGNNIESSDWSYLERTAYIKSFSELNNDYMMWSLYGDESRGICIEYDLSLLSDESPIWGMIFPVIYLERRPQRDFEPKDFVILMKQQRYEELAEIYPYFLVKGERWSSEVEWRLLATASDILNITNKGYIDSDHITIQMDCISGIHIGCRFNEELKEEIYKLGKDNGIPITEYELDRDKYEYRIKD